MSSPTPRPTPSGQPVVSSLMSPALIAPIAASFTFGAGLSLAFPLLALLLQSRGISGTWIGLNTAMAGVAAILATPIAAPLARRFGTARSFAISILVVAVSLVLFYVVQPFWAWFPLRITFHGGLTVMFVLSEFWINAVVPSDRRGLAMGIYGTVLSLGFAAGPIMLGLVGTAGAAPFLLGAAVLLVSTAPMLFARAHEPRIEGHARTSILRFVTITPIATFAAFSFGAIESGAASLLPVYGVELGYGVSSAAMLVAALAFGNVFSQVPLGLLADRVDRRMLLLGCGVCGTIGAALVPVVSGHWFWLLAVMFFWGGTVAGLYTVGLTHLGARFTGPDLASANAAFIMMYSVGVLVGPAAMGVGLDLWHPHGIAIVAAAFSAAFSLLALGRMLWSRQA